MKLQFVLICFLICIATAVALTGRWVPIKDLKDPNVVEIANFAINEHNKKTNTNLKLETIEKGDSQVVSGMNYRLLMVVNEGASKNKYEAVVWEKARTHLKTLVSFKPHKL
ncbi:Cysteine proteinase inhibitor [Euphorbia peplus]|nr:Cysteine proteinase inhibitor [Euphorbia peplus]